MSDLIGYETFVCTSSSVSVIGNSFSFEKKHAQRQRDELHKCKNKIEYPNGAKNYFSLIVLGI